MNKITIVVCLLLFCGSSVVRTQPLDSLPLDSLLLEEISILKSLLEKQSDSIKNYEDSLISYSEILKQDHTNVDILVAEHTQSLNLARNFIFQLLTQPLPDQSIRFNAFDNTFDAYIADVRKREVRFYLDQDKKRKENWSSLGSLKKGLARQDSTILLFATNGGMYNPRHRPQGLYIEQGRLVTPLDTDTIGYGNFYLHPNGVFYLTQDGQPGVCTTSRFDTLSTPIAYATQLGPMLVIDGERHPVFAHGSKNKYVRSGVGVIDEHRIVFIISHQPVSFYDFSSVFLSYFQCRQALYLDGNISLMYLPALERLEEGGTFGPIIGVTPKL